MMKNSLIIYALVFAMATICLADPWDSHYVEINADTPQLRSLASNTGMDIHAVLPDAIIGLASEETIEKLRLEGLEVTFVALPVFAPGAAAGFPASDSAYHDYSEMVTLLHQWASDYPNIVHLYTIGQSLQGNELWTVKISDNPQTDESASEPGIIIVGQHHAREHISREVPLGIIQYLIETYDYLFSTTQLLNTREIWITPALNPDGAEYDIATGTYQWWRKNRRINSGSNCIGVDLNRNYGYHWGESGSGSNPCDLTYRGPFAFSEPETIAFKNHVESHPNTDILLTYHNYSELILYPWGYTFDPIAPVNQARHQALGQVYADHSGYTLQQAAQLYTTSGDTVDWAYGQLGITSFTIELSPTEFGGSFYLPADRIPEVLEDNVPPAVYFIAQAGSGKTEKDEEGWQQILSDVEEYKQIRSEILPDAEASNQLSPVYDVRCGLTQVSTGDSGQLTASLLMTLVILVPAVFYYIRKRNRR